MANLRIIKDICIKKKITLKELSDHIGITQNGLQRILKTNTTTVETLEKIANYLQVPISTFFPEEKFASFVFTEADLNDASERIFIAGLEEYKQEILEILQRMSNNEGVTKNKIVSHLIFEYEDLDMNKKQIQNLEKSIQSYQRLIDMLHEEKNPDNTKK